jgi:hypothetical protein
MVAPLLSVAAPPSTFAHSRRQTPLPGPAQAPAVRFPSSLLLLDSWMSRLPRLGPRCCDLPRLDPSSLWSDRRLHGWIHRCPSFPDRIRRYPFFSAAGAATLIDAEACAVAGFPGEAPRRQVTERSKKALRLLLSFYVTSSIVDARTSTPPEEQTHAACLPTAATSTSATSASRGYHLLGAHTGLYSSHNIRTLTTLRLWGDFNPSAPTFGFYSSPIVCGAPVATAGGC